MSVVLLFPTELEASCLRALRPDLDIRICGVGVVETARCVATLLREGEQDLVLCGVAGCYDQTLSVGDVVSVERERTSTLPKCFIAEYRATMSLPLASVVSNTVMSVGAAADGAQIENMEGAALFALCAESGRACGEIRAISNRVDDPRDMWDIDTAVENLAKTIDKLFPIER